MTVESLMKYLVWGYLFGSVIFLARYFLAKERITVNLIDKSNREGRCALCGRKILDHQTEENITS